MKSSTIEAQNTALAEARRTLGCSRIYSEAFAKLQCERAYGRPLSRQLWDQWKRKVNAAADPPELGGLSEATYLLLLTNANLLKGNAKGSGKKVSRRKLAHAAMAILHQQTTPVEYLPEICGYEALVELITQQTFQRYSDRHYQRKGVYKGHTYTRAQVQAVLSTFPNHCHVQRTA